MVHYYKRVTRLNNVDRYIMIYTGISEVGSSMGIEVLNLQPEYLLDRTVTMHECIFYLNCDQASLIMKLNGFGISEFFVCR